MNYEITQSKWLRIGVGDVMDVHTFLGMNGCDSWRWVQLLLTTTGNIIYIYIYCIVCIYIYSNKGNKFLGEFFSYIYLFICNFCLCSSSSGERHLYIIRMRRKQNPIRESLSLCMHVSVLNKVVIWLMT